jgi:hypothetical protein
MNRAINGNLSVEDPDENGLYSWARVRCGHPQPSEMKGLKMYETLDMNGYDITNVPGGGLIPVDGSNVGTGCDVFKIKNGNLLEFHRVTGLDSKVTVTEISDSCRIGIEQSQLQVSAMSGSNLVGALKSDGVSITALKSNLNAVVDPPPTADSNALYEIGSRWINTTLGCEYVCVDPSVGAAVWQKTTHEPDGGEDNTSSNLGAGEGLAAPKVGVDLPFKSLVAGTNVGLVSDANTVTVNTSAEINTASNRGTGGGAEPVFYQKTGTDLEFKSLIVDGGLLGISSDNDNITITSTKHTLNAVAAPTATDDSAGGYAVGSRWIDVTADKEYVCVDASASAAIWKETTQVDTGEVNTASNVGTGGGQVFKQKTGADLELKTLKAGTNITINNNADDIEIVGAAGAPATASCWDAIVDGVGTDGKAYATLAAAVLAGATNICCGANTPGAVLNDSTDYHIHIMNGVEISSKIENNTPGSAGNIKISSEKGKISTASDPFNLTGGSLYLEGIDFSTASNLALDNVENLDMHDCVFSGAATFHDISYLSDLIVDRCTFINAGISFYSKTNLSNARITNCKCAKWIDVTDPTYGGVRTFNYVELRNNRCLNGALGIIADVERGVYSGNTVSASYATEIGNGVLKSVKNLTMTDNVFTSAVSFNADIYEDVYFAQNRCSSLTVATGTAATYRRCNFSHNGMTGQLVINGSTLNDTVISNNTIGAVITATVLSMQRCNVSCNVLGPGFSGFTCTTFINFCNFDNNTASTGSLGCTCVDMASTSWSGNSVDAIGLFASGTVVNCKISDNVGVGDIDVGLSTGVGTIWNECVWSGNKMHLNDFRGQFENCLISDNQINGPFNLFSGSVQKFEKCVVTGNHLGDVTLMNFNTSGGGKTTPTNCIFDNNICALVLGNGARAFNNKIYSNTGTLTNADQSEIRGTESASNVGAGTGQVFKQKSTYDLQLKSISAGTGIAVTNNTDDVQIAVNPIYGNACHATNYTKTIDNAGGFVIVSDNSATSVVSGMTGLATGLDVPTVGKYMVEAVISIDCGSSKDIEMAIGLNGIAQACRTFDDFAGNSPGEMSLKQIVDVTVAGHDLEILAQSATSSLDTIRSWSLCAQYLGP